MKKIILPGLLFLAVLLIDTGANATPAGEAPFTTLIVNADVTVILVDNDQASPQMVGRSSLSEFVKMERNGDTLVIHSSKKRSFKGAGVIYVPASQLRSIHINSEARVKTLYALHIPRLDVVINGACNVSIANIGELNMIETDKYEFEYSAEVREIPANLVRKKQ